MSSFHPCIAMVLTTEFCKKRKKKKKRIKQKRWAVGEPQERKSADFHILLSILNRKIFVPSKHSPIHIFKIDYLRWVEWESCRVSLFCHLFTFLCLDWLIHSDFFIFCVYLQSFISSLSRDRQNSQKGRRRSWVIRWSLGKGMLLVDLFLFHQSISLKKWLPFWQSIMHIRCMLPNNKISKRSMKLI